MNLSKLSVLFLSLFIVTFPVSVTISQTFAVLGSIFFILDAGNKKKLIRKFTYPIFIMGVVVYLTLFISYLFHLNSYKDYISGLIKGEISDIWFCIVFLSFGFLARDRENLNYFKIAYFFALGFILSSGLISMFTPFRLPSYILNNFSVVEGARAQHFAGELFGFNTYLPNGLMNTHLTFGGLLGLFYPGLIAYYIYKFPERKEYKNIFYSFIIILFSILLFYNQSRSIWIGILFATVVMIRKWNNFVKEFINKERIVYFLLTFALIFLVGIFFVKKNWLLQRAFTESIEQNTTENQRYFIFKNTINMIKDNPLLGVGPGNFYKEHLSYSNNMVKEHQELLYELSITPRGHAHNDLLHLFAVGGIFSFIAYVLFWFMNIRFFLEAEDEKDSILFSGFLVFFPAGFFQCYFLDDEVALPFFAFLAIFCGRVISLTEVQNEKQRILRLLQLRKTKAGAAFQVEAISIKNTLDALNLWFKESTGSENKGKQKGIIKEAFYILVIPLLFCFSYIFYLTSKNPESVYKRILKSSSTENIIAFRKSLNGETSKLIKQNISIPVKIEGCLTHYLNEKLELRVIPYSISFFINNVNSNYPKKVIIDIVSRDAFDQDKFYKAHSESIIYHKEYILENGKNIIVFDDLPKDPSNENETMLFRDFLILFEASDPLQNEMLMPIINLGKLCDVN
jgi:O-antigen ligase